jgi:hypothetical protein
MSSVARLHNSLNNVQDNHPINNFLLPPTVGMKHRFWLQTIIRLGAWGFASPFP